MIIIAHRGASAYCKENSLESIEKAVKMNSDIIEIDIRCTKDNFFILSHDSQILINNNKVIIEDSNYNDISKSLITLDSVLIKYPTTTFYLDIKVNDNLQKFLKYLPNIIRTYTNTFYIASFNINFIKNIDLNSKNCKLGILFEKFSKKDYNTILQKVSFIVLDVNNLDLNIFSYLDDSIEKYIYTVNNLDSIKEYNMLINGIVTDYPDIKTISKEII